MKKQIFLFLFSALLTGLLAACNGNAPGLQTAASTEAAVQTDASETTGNTESAETDGAVLKNCLAQYGTQDYWQDIYLPIRYVLLAKNEIVFLTAMPELPQTTAVPYTSVSGCSTVQAGDVTVIMVTDRNGNSYTVNLHQDDAADFTAALELYLDR